MLHIHNDLQLVRDTLNNSGRSNIIAAMLHDDLDTMIAKDIGSYQVYMEVNDGEMIQTNRNLTRIIQEYTIYICAPRTDKGRFDEKIMTEVNTIASLIGRLKNWNMTRTSYEAKKQRLVFELGISRLTCFEFTDEVEPNKFPVEGIAIEIQGIRSIPGNTQLHLPL